MNGNPDDQQLIDGLNKDSDVWSDLQSTYALLTDDDRKIKWGGGEKNERGVIHVPFPIYDTKILKIIGLLSTLHAITPAYHWVKYGFPSYTQGVPLSTGDAIRFATAIARSERLSEGSLANAIESGVLDAIVSSLLKWYQKSQK